MKARLLLPFALAETFSISGTRLSTIVLPWLAFEMTGDPVLTGLVGLAELGPYVLAKALGSPLIDRFGPRRIAILGDFLSAAIISLVPVLWALEQLDLALLLPLVALLGILRGPADAAKYALIPRIAEADATSLERVTGLIGVIERLATVVGAALAGLLIAAIGAGAALFVNLVAFTVSGLVVATALRPLGTVLREDSGEGSYIAQLASGWSHFVGDGVLVAIALMVMVTNLLDQAFFGVLALVWVQAAGHGPEVLGTLFAVFGAGSLLGAGCAMVIAERLPRLPVYALGFFVAGVPRFMVFAIDATLPMILTTLALGGFGAGFINPIIGAVMFERIPAELTGRVSAMLGSLAWALIPFGGVFGGALIAGLGLGSAFVVTGLVYLAATLAPLLVPAFRRMSSPGGQRQMPV